MKKVDPSTNLRLNKFISDSGVCSRRKADELIADGRVTVNGKKVFELGIKVDPRTDKVSVDAKPIRIETEKVYFKFHKPKGVLTSMADPLERPTIQDYVKDFPIRVFPIGRLDWDSEGLILLTNDGDLSQQVSHPKHDVTKTYLVKVNGQPEKVQLEKLLKGVSIVGGRVKAKHIEKVRRPDGSDQYDWLKIVITEGKNHQVRQMFAKIGFDVLKLQRVAIGRLKLGHLERGEIEPLNYEQIKKIFEQDLPELKKDKKSHLGKKRSEKPLRPSKKVRPKAFTQPE
ncbi:MAG: pseudouridine synthase [Bdellovibrionota bacterium]